MLSNGLVERFDGIDVILSEDIQSNRAIRNIDFAIARTKLGVIELCVEDRQRPRQEDQDRRKKQDKRWI